MIPSAPPPPCDQRIRIPGRTVQCQLALHHRGDDHEWRQRIREPNATGSVVVRWTTIRRPEPTAQQRSLEPEDAA